MTKHLNTAGKLTLAGQKLAAQLYDPSVGAITTWLTRGEAACQSRYGQLPQKVLDAAQTDRYLREDIALETFVSALPPFLKKLDSGEYDENRGASITTYFIGACRNRIGDVIRAHHAHFTELREDTDELLAQLRSADPGFSEIEGLELARHLLLTAPHDLRAALLLRIYEGITLGEAAKRLGLNPATVRSHLLRYKRKLAGLHFGGKIAIPADTALGAWIGIDSRKLHLRQLEVSFVYAKSNPWGHLLAQGTLGEIEG
ncbi:sigma-70 family RNA polymerase sigma factor [Nocardia xishanensis]|uniref:RNA polymerase sigma factor n=1 Tax=Nocardia xishanensis TaxID=238964 RepID=UPI003402F74B